VPQRWHPRWPGGCTAACGWPYTCIFVKSCRSLPFTRLAHAVSLADSDIQQANKHAYRAWYARQTVDLWVKSGGWVGGYLRGSHRCAMKVMSSFLPSTRGHPYSASTSLTKSDTELCSCKQTSAQPRSLCSAKMYVWSDW